ncbi:MAG: thiamine pyrophosphate-dependent enzyme [Cytophagales bacterium]|nr:thiamine pyrophosphate-dependent enzyme [Cytophagales bacterium]
MSLQGRKEVFMGRAKFGIFGDGKEIVQLAMARAFRRGDIRSGYYRDQTFMLSVGGLTVNSFFAQLYAHASVEADPSSAGRMMNSHFGTRFLDEKGEWKDLISLYNSSSDISPTAGQMPRLLGLAYASKLYRQNPKLCKKSNKYAVFSREGSEVAWGTIGNASVSEGLFLESLHAGAVLQVPMVISIWDDDYGISVPQEYHTPKPLYQVFSGYQRTEKTKGIDILSVKGWQYKEVCEVYEKASQQAREKHIPVLIHVTELTQPQGHSTSGSHERYKSTKRLDWEKKHDALNKMRSYILQRKLIKPEELKVRENKSNQEVQQAREKAWKSFLSSSNAVKKRVIQVLKPLSTDSEEVSRIMENLNKNTSSWKLESVRALRKAHMVLGKHTNIKGRDKLKQLLAELNEEHERQYHSHLMSESKESALLIQEVKPSYATEKKEVDGREVLRACFDKLLSQDPRFFVIGEDVGKIGDVNQGLAGLQAEYGLDRVTDTGIREATIVGQGIGAALRGLRPMVEIQYLDYLLYALQTLSDDLATLHYRTAGGQKAPLIIRTRGHRLEGMWHSGSPMGTLLHSLRGIHILLPRNMTQAAGFYNSLLCADEPALVIECLNGYRLKEGLPENIGDIRTPIGVPETIREGEDITCVTYGSMCRIVLEAAHELGSYGISMEVLDARCLLPFDINHVIAKSLKKTSRLLVVDEDVPGGASAYMLQQILEKQDAYHLLDSKPMSLTASAHRPAYGSDGDYFSKPQVEDVVERGYSLLHEADPIRYP